MTDRELLELAAKAIGITIAQGSRIAIDGKIWNPLTDDGDAFRLAVKLKMEIRPGIFDIAAAGDGYWEGVLRDRSDDCATTRLAIVRAAAAIGETK